MGTEKIGWLLRTAIAFGVRIYQQWVVRRDEVIPVRLRNLPILVSALYFPSEMYTTPIAEKAGRTLRRPT